jgi:hypothetical protein
MTKSRSIHFSTCFVVSVVLPNLTWQTLMHLLSVCCSWLRSTGDGCSTAPYPTSDIFRGPCTPILWFVFPKRIMRLITVRYFFSFHKALSVLLLRHTRGCGGPILTRILTDGGGCKLRKRHKLAGYTTNRHKLAGYTGLWSPSDTHIRSFPPCWDICDYSHRCFLHTRLHLK